MPSPLTMRRIIASGTQKSGPPTRGLQGIWFLGRNNLLLDPRDFSSANWTKTNVTVATDSIAGPDGVVNADTLTATGAGGTCVQSFTGEASTQYAHGVWLRRKTGIGDISLQWKAGTSNVVAVDGTWQLFSPSAYTVAGAPEGLTPGILIATSGDEVYAVAAQLNKGATLFPFEDRGTQQTLPIYRGTAGTLQRGAGVGAEATDPGLRNNGLLFDTDDYLVGPTLANVTVEGNWTAYVVGLFNGTTNTTTYFALAPASNYYAQLRTTGSGNIAVVTYANPNASISGNLAISTTNPCVVVVTHTSATTTAYRMDTGTSVSTADPAAFTPSTSRMGLGYIPWSSPTAIVNAFTGHAVALANVAHTPAERARMYAWLKSELAKPPYNLSVL